MCTLHSCTHWLRPRNLLPSYPTAFGLIYEGAISQPIKTTYLCDLLFKGLSQDGGQTNFLKTSVPHFLMMSYRLNPLLARFILLDATFNCQIWTIIKALLLQVYFRKVEVGMEREGGWGVGGGGRGGGGGGSDKNGGPHHRHYTNERTEKLCMDG